MIAAIAAMTRAGVIGVDNQVPWHYPEDFKRFKKVTLNSTIIMGRNTWLSLGEKPLVKRQNIVVSSKPVAGIQCATGLEAAFALAEHEKIWVIGGGVLYSAAMEYCDMLDITYVPDNIDSTDAITFPEISPKVWLKGEASPLNEGSELLVQRYHRVA